MHQKKKGERAQVEGIAGTMRCRSSPRLAPRSLLLRVLLLPQITAVSSWYDGIPSCDGPCPRYDNDGVCNVPGPCAAGTDCADCQTAFPTMEIVAACLSFGVSILLLALVCYYQKVWQAHAFHGRLPSSSASA